MRTFFSEWRKLRRPTLFFGTLGSVVAVNTLVTSLLFLLIDAKTGNADRGNRITREMLQLSDGFTIGFRSASGLLGIVALSVFAAQSANEYTYGTLRNLLIRQPKRLYLLIGKYFAMMSFAVVMVIVSAITSVAIAFGLSGKAKVATDAWLTSAAQSAFAHSFVNVLIATISYGTIGMVLGILFKSPNIAITVGNAFLLIIESLISLVWKPATYWMPGNLISIISSGGAPIGVTDPVTYSQAILRVVIFLLAIGLITSTVFKRRDVAN